MSTALRYPHIAVDDDGTARLEGTRYKVLHLAGEHYHYGWSAEEVLRQHPDLRPEQVYSALTYFYDNYKAMVDLLRDEPAAAMTKATARTFSRAELLERRTTATQ